MAHYNSVLRDKGIYGFLHVLVLALSLFLVIFISVDTFKGIPFYTQPAYMDVQFWVCMAFLCVFAIELFLSKNKLRYFFTHFVFLLVAIPYQNIIAYMGWSFSPEITYLIRFFPLVRGGYALAMIVGWLVSDKASGLFVSYLSILMATIYFASLVFFIMEHGVNANVANYSDSLWWAFMDVTTIGSNVIAVTPVGRILSVILAALGMMMFPIFTVYITTVIEKKNKEKKEQDVIRVDEPQN